ncbi:GNAT family N-acetyltransferase [Pyxidicoccus fallax]|uniref:GNAT family N-acetyltransferase n=1 Tax=Pyxidicoccus fallax TaxID=394095 RepID=A0A848LZQ4_9BACT|nr:GNAT family N-acetyltransferase [Pyxidicoccus fallax]NMO23617.1 GNAT family N-acetyltransferase [Pyxidicoccus fallax]NPC87079.1 GNAT family N-acetyltransferase [Pyxidicoccus fallax]
MNLVERLQDSMRYSARERYTSVRVPPFTAYFHPFDAEVYFNYAIPDGPVTGDVSEPLRRLRAEFQARQRTPRFEYVDALAPTLAGQLQAAGYRQEAEARLMVCTRDTFVPFRAPEGLTFSVLSPDSPRDEMRAFSVTTRQGFSPDEPVEVSDDEVSKMLVDLKDGRALLARMNGAPVSGGLFTPPHEGTSELAGVATLKDWRGRGIGAALVSRAAEEAFARGVEVLYLSTITEEAGRLYERVGFRFVTRMLFYVDASAPAHP